jgi:L(+)-tartrate dehydratase beta subunit
MTSNTSSLKTIHLSLPVATKDLESLELGTVVYLTGRIHTAREGVYKMAVEDRKELPTDIGVASFHCAPAASISSEGKLVVGAVTGTASFRFAAWLDDWFKLSGCKLIMGKGGMTSEIYRKSFVPNEAIYLTTVGYGTGALLGRGIKTIVAAHWAEELGIAQAMWVLEVENFGPFLAESDLAGNSLFERENETIARGYEKLYAGSKPPALRRYGETDDRGDEVF